MNTIDFHLKQGEEFIPLIQLLKVVQIASSGGESQSMVLSGMVQLNGTVEFRKRAKLRPGDRVTVGNIQVLIHEPEP